MMPNGWLRGQLPSRPAVPGLAPRSSTELTSAAGRNPMRLMVLRRDAAHTRSA